MARILAVDVGSSTRKYAPSFKGDWIHHTSYENQATIVYPGFHTEEGKRGNILPGVSPPPPKFLF